MTASISNATISHADVRSALVDRHEIALLDVREEDPFAQEHPLWAANLSLGRMELEAWGRIPRLDTLIAVYGDEHDASQATRAVAKLQSLGYTQVRLLEGGLAGWREAGGELFRDVNVPSKSFGELVESRRHTPSLSAEEVQALLNEKADVVVLDARRFDEYQTMNIPGSTSVPGGELVLRARELAPNPSTRVIVNCAGRTRSIIGTQSLVNAGLPNPVAALRNGTIGWTLAGQKLAHGSSKRFEAPVDPGRLEEARSAAAEVAKRAGVSSIAAATLGDWVADQTRTTYRFDVRTPEEYAAGHIAGFRSAPGGQLVQETDVHCPVRGARIVLTDDDGVRASMTASWLAQMGWHVAVLARDEAATLPLETGADMVPRPTVPEVPKVDVATLAEWLQADDAVLIDVTTSANFVKRHIPGAVWALRAQLGEVIKTLPPGKRIVLTCASSLLAYFAAQDSIGVDVLVLDGGNAAWVAAGLPVEAGDAHLMSPRIDRYRRPYEGTDNAAAAMQAYLDWEFGLVEQLRRDGTHHFQVI